MSFAEFVIQGRLRRNVNELEMSRRITGAIFESLPLRPGDTTLEREVLPDGSRGLVQIDTQEGHSRVVYNSYLLKDGQLVTNLDDGRPERKVRGIRKAKILTRIALGRVDHWDRESDFFGCVEESDE